MGPRMQMKRTLRKRMNRVQSLSWASVLIHSVLSDLPAPPANAVLTIQLSIPVLIYLSIRLFCSHSGLSASLSPGGKGSFPGAQIGVVKGRWEVAGESVGDDMAVGSVGVGRVGDIGGMGAFIPTGLVCRTTNLIV